MFGRNGEKRYTTGNSWDHPKMHENHENPTKKSKNRPQRARPAAPEGPDAPVGPNFRPEGPWEQTGGQTHADRASLKNSGPPWPRNLGSGRAGRQRRGTSHDGGGPPGGQKSENFRPQNFFVEKKFFAKYGYRVKMHGTSTGLRSQSRIFHDFRFL